MRIWKRLVLLLLTTLALRGVPMTAYAHPVPDLTKTGSITITMNYKGKAVPGGRVSLYKAGEVREDNGDYSFVPADAFKGCAAAFDQDSIQSPELAKKLAEYAANKQLSAVTTRTIGRDGSAVFSDLELGLYLVVQKTAASGYGETPPFLVSVPYLEKDQYIYDVKSEPKTDLEREAAPTEAPSQGGTLPQTGQLNWPIPVLVVLGLTLFAAGWVLRFGKKREGNE